MKNVQIKNHMSGPLLRSGEPNFGAKNSEKEHLDERVRQARERQSKTDKAGQSKQDRKSETDKARQTKRTYKSRQTKQDRQSKTDKERQTKQE